MTTQTPKRMTKAQILSHIAEGSELSKKDVSAVFDSLRELVRRELGRRGPGEFVVPELALKLKVRKVEAVKGKKFRNPQTGEEIIKDVPASKKLKATPLKKLKELVL